MKQTVVWAFIALFILISFTAVADGTDDTSQKEPSSVAMVLSSDSVQITGMALHMAWGMNNIAGADVTIILGAASLPFALKDGDSPTFPPKNKSIRVLLEDLVTQGLTIHICNLCAFAQKVKQEDLIEGITIETGMVIMPILADPNIKVITF